VEKSKRALYIEEREGKEIIEDDIGFVEYLHNPTKGELYITDMYILPEYRGWKLATKYHDEIVRIGKDRQCGYIMASFDTETKGWQHTLNMLESHDFKKELIIDTLVVYRKDL